MSWLKELTQVEVRSGVCFGQWTSDDGASRWANSWGGPPQDPSKVIVAGGGICGAKLLTWQPEHAGRYLNRLTEAYVRCRDGEMASNVSRAIYYKERAWPVCHAEASRAHDAAIGTGGSGHEASPPFVMRALYGQRVRVLAALRNPVDRLENAFWFYKPFWGKFGPSAQGLDRYVRDQTAAFESCEAEHGTRRCAHRFETLGAQHEAAFWHCNQLIRGMYAPFVSDWRAAFGEAGLLVLRVEDLLDAPRRARERIFRFVGLPPSQEAFQTRDLSTSYSELHLASLNATCCGGVRAPPEAMLTTTRMHLERFYAPHNTALARMLAEPAFAEWRLPGGSA